MTITVSNEGNLIIFLLLKDIAEWNKIIIKKVKNVKKNWVKNGSKNFSSTLFQRKDFMSQESLSLADVENIIFH